MLNIEFVIFVTYTNRPELTFKHVIWKKKLKEFTLNKQHWTVYGYTIGKIPENVILHYPEIRSFLGYQPITQR